MRSRALPRTVGPVASVPGFEGVAGLVAGLCRRIRPGFRASHPSTTARPFAAPARLAHVCQPSRDTQPTTATSIRVDTNASDHSSGHPCAVRSSSFTANRSSGSSCGAVSTSAPSFCASARIFFDSDGAIARASRRSSAASAARQLRSESICRRANCNGSTSRRPLCAEFPSGGDRVVDDAATERGDRAGWFCGRCGCGSSRPSDQPAGREKCHYREAEGPSHRDNCTADDERLHGHRLRFARGNVWRDHVG